MAKRDFFGHGVAAGMLVVIGADALHWFITPAAHPGASALLSVGVALQAVVALGVAIGIVVYRQRTVRGSDAV